MEPLAQGAILFRQLGDLREDGASSSVNPSYLFLVAVVLLADFCVAFVPGFLSAIVFADLLECGAEPWPRRYGSEPRLLL